MLCAAAAWAQPANAAETPVGAELAAAPQSLAPGESGRVAIRVSIAEGWHINSNAPFQDFLIATSLRLVLPEQLEAGELHYPQPVLRKLPFAQGEELALFEGDLEIGADLSCTGSFDASEPATAVLRYQACTDTLCKPPATIEIELPIASAAAPAASEAEGGSAADPSQQAASAIREAPAEAPRAAALHWEPFDSHRYIELKRSGRPFVLDFTAKWCSPCREMAERTFRDARVLAAAAGFAFMAVDMTTETRQLELIRQSFKVPGAPMLIFYDSEGREVTRKIGFVGPEEFVRLLRESAAEPAEVSEGERL